MTKDKNVVASEGRVRRHPLAKKAKLNVKDRDPNFHYRIVNLDPERPDRIEEFLERGYELVPVDAAGDKRVDNAKPISDQFSVGNGIKAVVMRQRKDWYDEDQKTKLAHIQELEDQSNLAAKKGY